MFSQNLRTLDTKYENKGRIENAKKKKKGFREVGREDREEFKSPTQSKQLNPTSNKLISWDLA